MKATKNTHRWLTPADWCWLAPLLVIAIIGFAGVDRWFYEQVSCALDTKQNLTDRDFYSVTKPFWRIWRDLFGSLLGAALLAVIGSVMEPRRWRPYVAGLITVVIVAFVANVAQAAIGRARPNQAESHLTFRPALLAAFEPPTATAPTDSESDDPEFYFDWRAAVTKEKVSFPSGEATTALALATVAGMLLPRWRYAFLAAGVLAAVARLVNGAHYVSDVAFGAALGVLASRWALHRLLNRSRKPQGAIPAAGGSE